MKRHFFTYLMLLITVLCSNAQNEVGGYIEDFEGGHYDGTSYLPNGWATTGAQPFYTLSWYTLPAHSGKYYAISIDINNYQSSVARDEWMYTCSFALEKGVTYSGSYWIHNDAEGPCTVSFAAGKAQTPEAQKTLHIITNSTDGDWEECLFEFTPEESGNYFFGWHVVSPDCHTTFVAIDDFSIMQAWMVNLPTAGFALPHIYNIATSALIAYPGQPVKIDNVSEKAERYEWLSDNINAQFSNDYAAEPTITFNAPGQYTITLNATNDAGTVSTSHRVNVEMGNSMGYYGVSTYDSWTDELVQRGTVPTFKTDLDFDFVTGPNHLYREFAERYAFSERFPVQISTINVFLTEYSLRTDMWQTQQNVPIEVIVYGEKDGLPDEDHIFGRSTATIGQAFGTTGVGGTSAEPRNIVLDKPIEVQGPAYISFRIGEDFCIDDDANKIIRSYMCFAPIRRLKTSTMVVRPYYTPSGIATPTLKPGDWCTAVMLDEDMPPALGMYNIVWVKQLPENIDGIETINQNLPTNNQAYDLQGRRLFTTPSKGIFIIDGRKVVM